MDEDFVDFDEAVLGLEEWENLDSSTQGSSVQSLGDLEVFAELSSPSPLPATYSEVIYDYGEYAGLTQAEAFGIFAAGAMVSFMVALSIMFLTYGVKSMIKIFRKGV